MLLRAFLERCQTMGELKQVSGATLEQDVGALAEINARRDHPAALLFEDIPQGYEARILTGTLSSPRRMALALGLNVESTADLVRVFRNGAMRSWVEQAPRFPPQLGTRPSELASLSLDGERLSLHRFPAPLWHPHDGGRYLGTGSYVLTRDPVSGWVNAGAYRLMVTGPDTLSLWMATSRHGKSHLESWWKQGQPCPVVAVLGDHPLVPWLAGAELPDGVSELNVAGAIRGEPLQAFGGELTGLPIPNSAELAVEGFLYPGDTVEEGPFGEGIGYYAGGVHSVPAIRVERVYQRPRPIILGSPPGKWPHDYAYPTSVIRAALIQEALEAAGVGGIQGVWSSYSRQLVVVAVRQDHPGHSRQAGMVAAHCGPAAYMARYIIVVDDDIDPTNLQDVMWAVLTRSDPAQDVEVVRRGWGSPIDPMACAMEEGTAYNSRAVIDACIPYTKRDVFPAVAASPPDVLEAVARRWPGLFD